MDVTAIIIHGLKAVAIQAVAIQAVAIQAVAIVSQRLKPVSTQQE